MIESMKQMNGSDYRQPQSDGTETRFSSWTPVTNKACNQQVREKNNLR